MHVQFGSYVALLTLFEVLLSVCSVSPGSLHPPKAFSRYKAVAKERWSCNFPATSCSPRGKPSTLSPKGHWVTGSPRILKIPARRKMFVGEKQDIDVLNKSIFTIWLAIIHNMRWDHTKPIREEGDVIDMGVLQYSFNTLIEFSSLFLQRRSLSPS